MTHSNNTHNLAIYLCTGGLLLLGVLYDYWTLNGQVDELNTEQRV